MLDSGESPRGSYGITPRLRREMTISTAIAKSYTTGGAKPRNTLEPGHWNRSNRPACLDFQQPNPPLVTRKLTKISVWLGTE